MSEPALRQLEYGLPRLEMRSPTLIAKQKVRAMASAPFSELDMSRLRSKEYASALVTEARAQAAQIIEAARNEADKLISAASLEATSIVTQAREDAWSRFKSVEDVLPEEPKVSVGMIIRDVAKRHGVRPSDITGVSRSKLIVAIRHTAIVEAFRARPDLTSPQLGKLFGGRDHTTILHALRKAGVYRSATT